MTKPINFIDNNTEGIDWLLVPLYTLLVVLVVCSALLFHQAWQQSTPAYPQIKEERLSLPTKVQSI